MILLLYTWSKSGLEIKIWVMEETVEKVINKHKASGRFFEVDGLKTFALDYGEGEVVFCLHGVPTSSYLYRKLLQLADKGFRGISIDLPGFGLSDRPENFQYSFRSLALFCSKAAEALEISQFHLVVHDIGGPIGFAFAAENREKI